jgi:N-acetylmuramoyl-L-alanine amidase
MRPTFTTLIMGYGHGGIDPATGRYNTPGGKQYHFTDQPGLVLHQGGPSLYEGVSNRCTARRLIAHALAAGVRVEDCVARRQWLVPPSSWRELEQADLALQHRTAYVNGVCGVLGADRCLYVSLHSNAVGNTIRGRSQSARGVDIYTSKGQTLADEVASSVHASMAAQLPQHGLPVRRGQWDDGDADHEAGFWVLRKPLCPAILPETGFFTNVHDARVLASSAGQDVIAAAIWSGIAGWMVTGAPCA